MAQITLSDIVFEIDLNNVKLSYEHCAFITKMVIRSNDFVFSNQKGIVLL